jgi:hypothetical protein
MRLTLIATAVAMSMSGCAVQKTLTPTGGSRSDGVVRLSYTLNMFEKPVVDYAQAASAARARCAAWGYSDAESFGGETQLCQQFNGYGNCTQALITVEYQCTGQPEATMPTPAAAAAAQAPAPAAKPATATYENHPGG